MSKLIAVVGNSGAGKTTLTRLLCERLPLASGIERLGERPFQRLFAQDLTRYALANQIDFLLYRAEQEAALRAGAMPGIQDGGLDEDFYVFTRAFHARGYLSDAELDLLGRLHTRLRQSLPAPELVIRLDAPLETLVARFAKRGRALEIARIDDLARLQTLLDDWLDNTPGLRIVRVDAAPDDPAYTAQLPALLETIRREVL